MYLQSKCPVQLFAYQKIWGDIVFTQFLVKYDKINNELLSTINEILFPFFVGWVRIPHPGTYQIIISLLKINVIYL